jgi:hypothetical protein
LEKIFELWNVVPLLIEYWYGAVPPIGFIRIDVEGHEYQCMLGLVNTIQKYNPVIMIEVHDSCPQQADTFNLLYELNYTKYIKLSHCDYVFFKKNSSEDVI